jgi:hypothetical protein
MSWDGLYNVHMRNQENEIKWKMYVKRKEIFGRWNEAER